MDVSVSWRTPEDGTASVSPSLGKNVSSWIRPRQPFPESRQTHTAHGIIMRMLMNVRIPPHQFNAAAKDGSVGAKLNRILKAIKPEAVYFT